MTAIHGKGAVVYLAAGEDFLLTEDGFHILLENGASLLLESSPGDGEAQTVLEQTDWSIDFTESLYDTTRVTSTWRTWTKGLQAWTADLVGNLDIASTLLWTSSTGTVSSNFYLYPQGLAGHYYFGTVWVRLNKIVDGGVSKKASNTVRLEGSGALQTV